MGPASTPSIPPRSPKQERKRTKNRRPTGATARPVPTPPPARQSPPSKRPTETTELRTQHPRPRSTGNRAGRDAPCRSRSPEKEGKATKKKQNKKSIKEEENCDIAIFVVRLIVAVRFPNTKSANS